MAFDLLEPKEMEFTLQNGSVKTFILSKFPAIQGREIVTQYPLTAAPKIGDYKTNEALMLKVLGYVAVKVEPEPLRLSTMDLINNHVGDYETLLRIEYAMMEYNCSFFGNGALSGFLDSLGAQVSKLTSKMLTTLSQQLSENAKQP